MQAGEQAEDASLQLARLTPSALCLPWWSWCTHLRKQFAVSNPFVFKHISDLKGMQHFDDSGPCVVMASPGMLQVRDQAATPHRSTHAI
jgi:hypothetical protein